MIEGIYVINIAIVDEESTWEPEGFTLVEIENDSPVDIGWTYVDGIFYPPETEEEVEETLTIVTAEVLEQFAVAAHTISALKVVRYLNQAVAYATNNTTYKEAMVCGITKNAAAAGAQVKVIKLGKLEDPFFNYDSNTLLFLGEDGEITDAPSSGSHATMIGYGLGPGAIYVKIEQTINL